jgi:hypothetical protein
VGNSSAGVNSSIEERKIKTKLPIFYEELYDNCLYSSIAKAVWCIKNPMMSYSHSWDGMNYNVQEGSARGTITFDIPNTTLVGVIEDLDSSRIGRYPEFKAIELLNEAPETTKALAVNETFYYQLDTIYKDVPSTAQSGFLSRFAKKTAPFEEIVVPVATIAFWSEGNEIFTSDILDDFVNNGGESIVEIMMPAKELRAYWEVEYEFTAEESKTVDYLFQLKKNGDTKINMDSIPIIKEAQSDTVNGKVISGDEEFIKSMAEMGFSF